MSIMNTGPSRRWVSLRRVTKIRRPSDFGLPPQPGRRFPASLIPSWLLAAAFVAVGGFGGRAPAAESAADPLFKALEDELQRSMTLRLEDLDRPYFIQYAVDDTQVERVAAAYGALTQNTIHSPLP